MARAKRWTDEKIKATNPVDGREKRHLVDSGLYLFVRQRTGGVVRKQWQYRVQVDGVRRWLSLGEYPAIGLAEAKAQLLSHQRVHDAAKKGDAEHPVAAEKIARQQKKDQPTVAAVFDEWIADKQLGSSRKQGKPVRERTVFVLRQNFDGDVRYRIGDLKIASVTQSAIRSCIDAARKRSAPGAAAQIYRTLRGLVLFALSRGYLQVDPMRGIENPKPYRPQPVNAATDAEIVTMLRALDASSLWPATKLAIELQLLTGARPTEIRLATWGEIDVERRSWVLPDERVKSGRSFRIHLSTAAIRILEQARASATRFGDSRASEYVFAGAKGGPMEKMAIARALSRLADRTASIGGKKLRPHDVRRTFRTMLSRLGVLPHIAELCMNHQETETMRRVYDGHTFLEETTEAWDRVGAHVTALRQGGATVVSIRDAKRA